MCAPNVLEGGELATRRNVCDDRAASFPWLNIPAIGQSPQIIRKRILEYRTYNHWSLSASYGAPATKHSPTTLRIDRTPQRHTPPNSIKPAQSSSNRIRVSSISPPSRFAHPWPPSPGFVPTPAPSLPSPNLLNSFRTPHISTGLLPDLKELAFHATSSFLILIHPAHVRPILT